MAKSSKPNRRCDSTEPTKGVSSPCITARFFSVRTAISGCTDQNSLPRFIKHPLLHCKGCSESGHYTAPSSQQAGCYCFVTASRIDCADKVVLVSTLNRMPCQPISSRTSSSRNGQGEFK
eukprot:scaffold47305_cov51-Phaeocystis_antarctica.AAC.1